MSKARSAATRPGCTPGKGATVEGKALGASGEDDLQTLAARINREYALAVDARDFAIGYVQKAMQHALETGQLLNLAKAQVKHGEWMAWVKTNTNVPHRTANEWMRLAANSLTVANLGVSKALRVLASPKPPEPVRPAPLVPPTAVAHEAGRPARQPDDADVEVGMLTQLAEDATARPGGVDVADKQPEPYVVADQVERQMPWFADRPNDTEGQVDYLSKRLTDALAPVVQQMDWCGDEIPWQVHVAVWDRMAQYCNSMREDYARRHESRDDWPWKQAPDEWLADEVTDALGEKARQRREQKLRELRETAKNEEAGRFKSYERIVANFKTRFENGRLTLDGMVLGLRRAADQREELADRLEHLLPSQARLEREKARALRQEASRIAREGKKEA